MKRLLTILTGMLLLASCVREEPADFEKPSGKQVTIRVSMSEDAISKVDFTDEGDKLHLSWHGDETIRIISGEVSKVYTLTNRISDHEAEFSGDPVPGTSFDILIPGSYATVEEAEEDTTSPAQTENKALLSGVNSYSDIEFKSSWASAHGGTLKQGAAVRLVATLPGGVSAIKKAGIMMGDKNYTLPLSGVDVSASAQELTAYMMLPWDDIDLPDGSNISVYVLDNTNEAYGAQVSVIGDKTVLQGKMNTIGKHGGLLALTQQDFVAGNGTAANPYLIANARQLDNMHKSGVLVADQTKYFRLLEDIDANSITNWAPLNSASPFKKAIDFDGDGHTISNLSSSASNYASFVGVLNGLIHDVTFDKAIINHTSKIGVVGGFIGTTDIVGSCTNVHVKNSSVSGSTSWMGGFAAEINTTGTLNGCSVENTAITITTTTGKQVHLGGFAGIVRSQSATLIDCYTKNLTLTYGTTPYGAQGLGGFVGCTTANASFNGCHVDGPMEITSTVTTDGTKKVYVGGFIGYIASAQPSFEGCYVEGSGTDLTVSGKAETGGFVGFNDRSATYTDCRVTGVSVSGIHYLGGFMGYGGISTGYEVPSIFTRCKVQNTAVTQNLASASGSIHTGGFAGTTAQALSFINCEVTGTTVKATEAAVQNVGGFIGCTTYAGANFQGCTVDGASSVEGKANSVGGFVGWAYVPDAYKECSSAASVKNSGSYTGGFVGHAAASSSYTSCIASGKVESSGAYTGGFVGRADVASFTSCHYDNETVKNTKSANNNTQVGGFIGGAIADVSFNGCYVSNATIDASQAGRSGGFAGQLGGDSAGGNNISTTQCYVTGTNVDGSTNSGGFVGVQYGNTTKCYVEGGTVTAHNAQVGGFSAFVQNCDVTHCYTTASVVGGSYADVGGFAGHLYQGSIENCYSSGTQSGNGTNRSAFVAQCKNALGSISNCIGWHATLPFCAAITTGASITNGYAGTNGTVSGRAKLQEGWISTIWNLEGDRPLLIPGSASVKAVFVGDSITWQWARVSRNESQSTIQEATHNKLGNEPLPSYMSISGTTITIRFHPGFFSGNGYIDKGISGQNTTQMRDRFEKDVIALNPKVFVIMGGTNDLAQGVSEDAIFDNISYMASKAKEAGIKVIICSITPNNREYSALSSPKTKGAHIEALNVRFKDLCDETDGYVYCDYWTSLVARNASEAAVATDIDHGLKDEYKLYDDLHPGPAAYTVMEGIVKPIINSLL